MSLRTFFAALLVAGLTADASAQVDPSVGMPLSLSEAERRALDLNPQVAEARLSIEAADFTVAQRQAAFATVFTTSFSQRSQTNPATTQLIGGSNVTTVNNEAASYGSTLTTPLQWGGARVTLDFGSNRTTTSNLFANFNPSYSSSLTTTYTQPLLRGFGIDQTREQLAQARLDQGTADTAFRQQAAQILASVRRAYWDLVYTVDALETARQSRALAERQLDESRLRLQLGTVAQIDVLQAEAEVATRVQAAVQAEGAWRAAQVALKQLIVADTGDPLWASTVVPTDRPGSEVTPNIDVEAAVAQALGNRTDIENLRRQGDSIDLNLRLLDDQRKPSVDLNANLAFNGIGGTRLLRATSGLGTGSVGTIPGGYLDAFRTLGSLDFPTWTVALNISVPLDNGAANAAAARGRVQRRQVDARLRTLELQVAATITRLADQVTNVSQQVEAAAVARQLAEQRVEVETQRLQAGVSTTFLVLQAQRDLATAQTNELRAQLDFRNALVDLEQAQEAP